jgi:hypothetical protein
VTPGCNCQDSFGWSVALEGTTAVVGALESQTPAGALYLYVKGGSGWPTTPTVTIPDPPGSSGADEFGTSVALSATTLLAGALADDIEEGTASLFVEGTSGWPTTPTATLHDPAATTGDAFGGSVAVSDTHALIGAYGTKSDEGAAYLYGEGEEGWPATPSITLHDPAKTPGDTFGLSVAISAQTAAVGAPAVQGSGSPGAAYLYKS